MEKERTFVTEMANTLACLAALLTKVLSLSRLAHQNINRNHKVAVFCFGSITKCWGQQMLAPKK